ncbi:MAG: ddrB-like ParB superfamily domain protein [Bacteriophage sp.]|nr:MAG: ddrB-like ParB superfamily domain protein [Bacteriophage sp.]
MWNDDDRKWLYEQMKKNGVNTGSYDDFTKSLDNKEDRDWYYQKSRSLGLNVGSADDFASMMVQPVQKPAPAQPVVKQTTGQVNPTVNTSTQPKQDEQPQKQGGWQPTWQEKMGMQMQLDKTMRQVKQSQQDFNTRMENIRKGNTLGKTSEVKFNPESGKMERRYYTTHGDEVTTPLEQSRLNLKYRDEWEATTPEGRKHREKRIENDFERRVGASLDKYDPDNAAAMVWQQAEDKSNEEFGRYLDERSKPSWSNFLRGAAEGTSVTGGLGADNVDTGIKAFATHLKYHDLQRMADDAWNMLGKEKQQSIIEDMYGALKNRYPQATEQQLQQAATEMAREQSDRRMYELAVAKNAPKDAAEYFIRKVAAGNAMGTLMQAAARAQAGTTGDWEAREDAEQRFEKQGHKVAGIAGTVTGFALDPLTWASAGAGGAAVKGTTWLGGKMIGKAAMRKFGTTLGGRMLGGAIGGAVNFGTYEAGSEALDQMKWGGYIDEETGERKDGFSFGNVAGRAGHGLMMGAVTGVIAPYLGNVSDKLVRATESTVGKMGIRAGELGVGTVAEGTIFAVPEIINTYGQYGDLINSLSDETSPNYIADEQERAAKIEELRNSRGDALMDVWTDNMAMIAGFKAQHLLKSAPRVIYDLARSKNGKAGFETRLRSILDGRGDLALTEDEKKELERRGYGDLKDLTEQYSRYAEAKEEYDKARPTTTDASRMIEGGDVQAELPYNRFVELMTDNSVSEAARAKMYYYLTGHGLPMSTVMGSSILEDKDADGNVTGYTVQSFGANGVITSRSFGDKKRADVEVNRINRQAELNGFDVGERYYDWQGDNKRMYEACETVAEETGAPANLLFDLMKRKTEAMNEVELEWAEKILNAYNGLCDKYGSSEVRTAINEEFGVDVDKAIRKERNRRSEQEQKAVDEYASRLFADVKRKQEEAAERGEAPVDPDAPTSNSQIAALLGIDDGEQGDPVSAAFNRGHEADAQERQDIAIELTDPNNSEAQEAWNGVVQRINEDAAYMVAQQREQTKQMQHTDGSLRPAILKEKDSDGNDQQVYIVDGNVQMMPDGSVVDKASSDNIVVIYNPATGERKQIDPSADTGISSLGEVTTAEQREADIERSRQEYVQAQIDEAQGTVRFVPGQQLVLPTGEEAVVVATDADGENITVALGDGTQATVQRSELQRIRDEKAAAEYRQRHGITEEPVTQQPEASAPAQPQTDGRVAGAPADYTADMELTIRDEDGSEKPAMVMGRVRYENGSFVPDANGNIIEYFMDGEVKHDHEDKLVDKVVSHVAPQQPEAAPVQEASAETPATVETTPPPVEQQAEVAPQPVQEPVQTVEPQPTQPAEAPAQPIEQPTAEPMPVGEDGEEDWQATTPERAHAYIFNEAGLSRSEGNEFIAAQTQAAQSALVKAKSAQMPRVGTSIKKYNEAKAKRQEKIDEAQRVLDYWQQVRNIQNDIQRVENERRAAEDAVRHDEAVAEAQAEYEARKQAEAERKAVGNENPMPAITEKWNNATKVDGHRDEIMLPDGTPLKGHYVLHESGASSPSHNPETWQKTDGFPMDANDNSVNDRDYERDHDAQEHTQSIARQYDQRALQSVPVVSNDGVVLSGNGRTMAGELAARDNTDGAYVNYLKEYAPKFGFTPEQVEAMQHPRVSFVPDEAMPYTAETFAKFNQQEMKSQNKTEQAVKLGKTVNDDSFKGIVRTINGYDTLGDFYNDAEASLGAVYDLHNAGVVPQAQLAEMVDGVRGQEKLSAVGREFLENMLIGKAFEGDPEVVRMLTAEPAMRQTVITALGEIVDNIALGGDWSLQGELADAVKLCFDARQGGAKYGEIVSTYARQGVLFADPDELQTVADFNNATMLMLADVLNDKRVTLLKTTLQLYNNNARQSAVGQADLFAGGIQSREDILRDVITFINENYGKRKEIEAARAEAVERRKAESVQQDGTPPAVSTDGEATAEPSAEPAPVEAEPVEATEPVEAEPNAVQTALAAAEQETNTEPTEAQKEAGNYKKGHVKIDGYDVTIENPKGSVRRGTDASGKQWEQEMQNTYGYIRGTEGVDGDHIDVFFSEDPSQGDVFVVDQVNKDGSFDEHKVMYGFPDIESARKAYLSNYEDGWQGLGAITPVSKEEFKKWIDSSHRKTKPFAEYSSVKPLGDTQLGEQPTAGYSIEPTTYTNKKGKTTPMHLVTFGRELSKDEIRAGKELAKESRGWWDREKGGFMMRDEDSAKALAEALSNEEAVQDAQPLSVEDVATVTDQADMKAVDETIKVEQEPQTTPQYDYDREDDVYDKTLTGLRNVLNDRKRGAIPNIKSIENVIRDLRKRAKTIEDGMDTAAGETIPQAFDALANLNGRRKAYEQFLVDIRKKMAETERDDALAAHGVKLGDKIMYKGKEATIHDADTKQVTLDTGMAPVLYEVTDWENVELPKPVKEYHGGDRVFSVKHNANKDIFVAHHKDGTVEYTFTDGTKANADEVQDALPEPKKVNVESLMGELNEKGEAKLSDHIEEPQQEESTEQPKQEEKKAKSKWVDDADAERFEELRRRLRQKLGGQLNMGVDPEAFALGVEMSYLMLKHGARKFAEFAKQMIEALGENVRPYLKSFYNGARDLPEMAEYEKELTPYDEVRTFDVMNFDKEGAKDIVATAEHIVREQAAEREAKEATDKLKQERNEQRKETEQEVAANTEALASEAATVASEVESKLPSARSEREVNDLAKSIDDAIDKVNDQLALLGYYEAEPVESDFNEAYGYMRNAEKKAVKNITELFKTLTKELGISDPVVYDTKGKKQKSVTANIAPAGGDVTMRFMLNRDKGVELYIDFMLEPDYENNRDNLVLKGIMFRPEKNLPNGGRDYLRANNFFPVDVTVPQMLQGIRSVCQEWLPAEDYVAMAQRIAAENAGNQQEKPSKERKSKKKSISLQEQTIPDLFSGLFSEDLKPTSNEQEVHVQPRTSTTERERGHQREQNEPLGESKQNEDERPDAGGVVRRSGNDTKSDTAGGSRVSELSDGKQNVKPAKPEPTPLAESERKNTHNNHAERGTDYAPKGTSARIEANIKAIETMQRLIESGEPATPEDMSVLRKFSGWGGLGAAFKEKVSSGDSGYNPRLRDDYQPANPINARLRELLSPEAYEAANMSRNSAYYTPAPVIDAMWDVARAMGFRGGNVLEGSAGIGNIIGLMPTDMSERSNIHAVEIDETTGNILSLLYPDANVEVKGFEKTFVPNGSVDLAITNVPFVTGLRVMDETGDKDLSRKFHDIHDFCIAKNVRKLKEGGVGIFITSSGTLDSPNSAKLRTWLVNEGGADVVGAFRMHNQTFGGTGATSDIIVIRKRVNGRKSANAIDVSGTLPIRTVKYNTGETKRGSSEVIVKDLALDVNKHFVEHPEDMAGEMAFAFEKGDTYRATSKALYPSPSINQEQRLSEWAQQFKDMDWDKAEERESQQVVYEDLGEDVKEGSMLLDSDGNLCLAQRGKAVPINVNANKVKGHTKAECFNAYKAIKDALADVLEYQTTHSDDSGLQQRLAKLNKAYDSFVKTYGHLNKNTSISFLRSDMDYPSIAALESVSETGDKSGKRIVTYGKTDIFSRRVVETESEPKPTTIKDGIIASIYLNGRVDVPYIAEQLNMSDSDVRQQIIESGLGFENPTTTEMEVSYEYLSGNVREKLRQAQENNTDGRYDANIKALERVIPMNIPAHLIEFTLGSSWVEPKLYEDFVKERTGLDVKLTNAGGTWIMSEPYYTNTEQNRAMGVISEKCDKTIYGHELIKAAITCKSISVTKTISTGYGSSKTTETIVDKEATMACANKIDEIRQDFKDWARGKMQGDPEMSERMERVYNELFNNSVPKEIPDEFVPEHFGGAATVVNGKPFKLRPHQAKAVIRATTQPLMLAHEVGTGKTYTLISTAMEMRRLGTARKPMIVVQNATVGQFVASAKALYPNAKILTLEDADRNAEGRRNFYAKIRYNDWDMIVVPQSVFERIPDSEERQIRFIEDKVEEKMMVLEKMREAANDDRDPVLRQAQRELDQLNDELNDLKLALQERKAGGKTEKDEKREAKTRQNAMVKAQEMLDRETDDVANFDDMGIDALLIDEAHEYKHLGFATAMQRGVKGVDPSYSKKSQGVYLKTQAVLENKNGKNVVFATGTPISNTAAEIWTFMRYLMPADTMREYGIYYFDDFVRNFGNIQQMLEFSTNGKYKENNRFAGYVNLPELVRIWAGVADTVLTREAGGVSDKIPKMDGEKAQDIYLPQTKALRGVMKFVKDQLDDYEKMSGKEKKENSHIPLVMYGIAKAAAVDARLVLEDAADEPNSKTNEAVRQTLRSLEYTKEYNGTVAIFADNYQNKATGFNLYEDIRKKLIDAGVPEAQVVVMKSGMSIKKKLEIFDKVNRGEVRVIMGSTFTLGTGVNIQERLHTLIHVDAPNRPMDYTQRNGRILRQGNLHNEWGIPVRVLRFGVEDSLDVTAYQRLKTKGAIADSIMEGKKMMSNSMENRVLEEEQDLFGDITAQLSGSQYALLKNQVEKEVKKLEARKKQWEADQTYVHNQKPRLKALIKDSEKRAKRNKEALAKVEAAKNDGITIGKMKFPSLDAMGDYIKDYNSKQREQQEQVRTASGYQAEAKSDLTVSVGGFDFHIHRVITKEQKQEKGQLSLSFFSKTQMTYSCPQLGLEDVPVDGQRLKSALEDILENVLSGDDFREKAEYADRAAERYKGELQQVEARDGKPFEYADELKQAKEKLAEYEELMKAEMAEKEAKYAEMDASVEAAKGVQLSDEDSDDITEDTAKYRIREDEPPTKTGIGYKVFVLKDGKLYPPMVANPNGEATPVGVWLDADSAPVAGVTKTGRQQVKAGGKGTQGGSGKLAYRPGWHLGEIPYALQFNRMNPETGQRELFPANFVWAEVEYANDVDYQEEAMSYGMNASGKFQHSLAGLPRLPENGSYRYRTNPDPNTDPWVITGAMKVNRILKPSEVDAMVEAAGREPQQRQAGAITDEQVEALNAKVKRTMQEDRDMMRSAVLQMGEKLHTNINIIEDVNEITHPNAAVQERRRKSKGWYDTATGQVNIVLDNNKNIDDVKASVGHETIAHKGLRELVGEENYDEFLDETYQHLRDDLKKGVDAAAGRAFVDDATKNGKRAKSYEQHRRTAVDELFGRMAEKPFEEFSEGERTLWQKIKATVRRLLDKFLGSLKLPKWFELGDNELRYILWRSKEHLERGKEHPIDLARDIVKREELGLTDEARYNMGDAPETFKARQRRAAENKGTVMPGLNDAQVKVVDVPRHQYKGRNILDQARDAAIERYNKQVGTNEDGTPKWEAIPQYYNNYGISFFYEITPKALKSLVQHHTKSDNVGVHAAVLDKLHEVINGSIEYEEDPDVPKINGVRDISKGVNNNVLIHRFIGAVRIDGKPYRVISKIKEYRETHLSARPSTYQVTEIEVFDEETPNTPNGSKRANGYVHVAKLLKDFEKKHDGGKKILDESKIADESTDLYRDPDETEDIWNDQSLGLQERITAAATRLANNHRDNKTLRNDAMRAIGGNLSDLRKAMSLQRTFDMTTVKRVADLARVLMNNGYLNGLTQQEVKRLLAAVKNSVGHNDIEGDVQKVMDIMVDNQLKHAEDTLHELEAIRGSKVDARGVEVQGQLDPAGAHTMKVFKKTRGWEKTDIEEAISEAQQRMGSSDVAVADEAALEYTGLQLALEYAENIKDSKVEERKLREEIKQAHDDASERDRATDSYRQYIASLQEAIRQNKIERAQSYFDLVGRLSDSLRESIANAKDFKEAEKQRIREIQHNANSDMEGRPSDEHYKPTFADKFVNNSFVSFLFAPLATFDQMLRMFGSKSANGEGYLYNRFMRGWIDARQKEINGVRDKYAILDAKAAELFGGKVKTWGDLIRRVGKLPKGTVSFWNGGEMQERELTQGNLMYIYMVNKMLDGRMKLRKMGITEENVADIEEVLDPRLIELADWLQDEFLVQTRNEYNETHKRMFGASMAAIEHYFPLKILANARADKPEDLDNPDKSDGISTATGSIIKRRRNALALDITGADALSVILDHVAQMEHWNAFAEFNRDINTLRTYKRFRNQVQNMTTIYGSGKELWKKFNDVCQMAAGTYRPPRTKLDEAAVNFAKGVTAAKVSFRMFTALKQFLSMPAYIPEARTDYLLRNIANPVGAWKWSMEHLPIFSERWRSRMSGDPRLLKSDMDWKMWRTRLMQLASRAGMSPNAFVDALTVSIGAHSMYQTRLALYLRDGYSEADAEKKAVQDAEVLYNQTQQSSEGAFTSTMQVDRSWLSVLFTVFRNASMSYQRQLHDAFRNFKHNLTPGGRARSIEFMTKQYVRDGIDEAQAEQNAKRKFRRQLLKDTMRVATFGYIMQFAWNLGAYLPYLLFGDDEDEKQKMWDDVWAHTAFGSVEGLTGGDLMSQAGQMMLTGEGNPAYLSKDMPLTSDIMAAFQKLGNGQHTEALNDMINLIVQAGLGVNPQSITDVALSIMDACGDDPALAHEATICISRILQVPQSQIDKMYFDEVGLSGDEVSKYTPAQLAERYAQFKVKRGRFFSPWSWGDEERIKKFTDKANKTIKERTEQMGDDKVNEAYLQYEEVYKGVDAKVKEAKKTAKTDYVEAAQLMADAQSDPNAFATYQMFKQMDGNFNKIVKFYLGAKTPDEAALCRQAVLDYKSAMVKVLDAPDAATRAEAMGNLGNVMQEFTQKYVPMQQPNR